MPLILLPAVDVVEGRAVRLVQGRAGSETECLFVEPDRARQVGCPDRIVVEFLDNHGEFVVLDRRSANYVFCIMFTTIS